MYPYYSKTNQSSSYNSQQSSHNNVFQNNILYCHISSYMSTIRHPSKDIHIILTSPQNYLIRFITPTNKSSHESCFKHSLYRYILSHISTTHHTSKQANVDKINSRCCSFYYYNTKNIS